MEYIINFINGLSLGGIYAMIALGYTIVYGIAKMLNFAHGDIIMAGGYTVVVTLGLLHQPIVAVLFAIIFCTVLGVCIEKVAYKPLRGSSPLAVLITAIGMSYLLQSLAQIIFGSAPKMVLDYLNLGVLGKGAFTISVSTIVTLSCTVVLMTALTLFIKYAKIGRAMVAVSEDKAAAKLMGININSIITITFAIGSAFAGLSVIFYFMLTPTMSPTFGAMPGIKAFTAAVIGGIGSIPGAIIGGVLLGVIECFSNMIPQLAPYTEAIEFGLLIIILLVKPSGILGKMKKEKV